MSAKVKPRKPKARTRKAVAKAAPLDTPLRLEWRDPAELADNPANWREHPQAQLAALSDVIDEVGWAGACLYNEATKRLIDGHARKKVGKGPIPVLVGRWTEEQERTILATLDPLAGMAEANAERLDALLREVNTGSEAIQAMLAELADEAGLYQDKPEVNEDDVPDPPKVPVTKPGDLWLLGRHRLLCGDSTKPADVGRVLDGRVPFIMVTDPPYGVECEPEWRAEAAAKGLIGFSASRVGAVANDDRVDWTPSYTLFPGHVAYVWHAGRHTAELVANLQEARFEIRTQIIWRKPSFAISRGHYHWQHEPCWYAVRDGGSAKWCGDRSQSTVWDIKVSGMHGHEAGDQTNHGTQKPVECMARPIRNHGGAEDDVYDPFVGSGTTIIAAEQLNRACHAIEISLAYVDVCVERWQNLTGEKAKRGGN